MSGMAAMCTECGLRPAKIHYTEIVNNSMVAMDLCVECAQAKGIDVQKPGGYGLGDLVAGLIDTAARADTGKIGMVRCARCGYDYSSFKKVGRLGCPECYDAFGEQLEPLLRQLHGSTRHQGKTPAGLGDRARIRRELADLQEALSEAVAREDYETAATIRDRIKSLEIKVEEGQHDANQ